jgi:uncharacterized damage-inducible protein DinB
MPFLAHFRDLLAYDRWANRRALHSIRAFGEEGDPDALKLLAHIVGSSRIWITRLAGGDSSSIDTWPPLDFDACAVGLEMMYERWSRYLEDLTEEELGALVAYRDMKGISRESRVSDTLTHVMNHGTYHRAQIATIVREKGMTPASTDFIIWAREERGA